jgi:2-polyprenyl-6-methoxyphenol hydroxylase-like FAD-dependent oxidoreductase
VIRRALIVGGGPGGMTASIALARAGVQCTIFERDTDWAPAGIGIGLQSPPLRALKALDLFDDVVAVGHPTPEIDMLRADGEPLGRMPQVNVNDPDDPPFVTMPRTALHEVLERRLRELGVEVRLGTTIASLDEAAEYDLVVGADGLHSKVRPMILPDAPAPQYAGQVIWRIGGRAPAALERYTMMIAGPTRIGLVPLGGGALYMWMLDGTMPPQRPPREEILGLFQERLAAYAGVVPDVAAQITEPEQVDFRDLQWLLVEPPWHRGRALLLGDAAHTTTPHMAFGVGLAIEDAVVLGEMVAKGLEGDALGERYATRRIDRCRLVVESSLQLSRWEQEAGPPNPAAGSLIGQSFAKLAEPI